MQYTDTYLNAVLNLGAGKHQVNLREYNDKTVTDFILSLSEQTHAEYVVDADRQLVRQIISSHSIKNVQPALTIRSVGDSWAWSWGYDGYFKSNRIKNIRNEGSQNFIESFPSMQVLLNGMGVNYQNFNHPGCPMNNYRCDQFSDEEWLSFDYLVAFVSDPFDTSREKYKSKSIFDDWLAENQRVYLQKLSDCGKRYSTHIFLFGGQATLPRSDFEKIVQDNNINTDYLHLVSEDILKDIMVDYFKDNQISHRWKFSTLTSIPLVEELENWDPSIIDEIHRDKNQWDNVYGHYGWLLKPCAGHLSPTGFIYFLDMLFEAIEKVESD